MEARNRHKGQMEIRAIIHLIIEVSPSQRAKPQLS